MGRGRARVTLPHHDLERRLEGVGRRHQPEAGRLRLGGEGNLTGSDMYVWDDASVSRLAGSGPIESIGRGPIHEASDGPR